LDRSSAGLLGDLTLDLSKGLSWDASHVGLTVASYANPEVSEQRAVSANSLQALNLTASPPDGLTIEVWLEVQSLNSGTKTPVIGFGLYPNTSETDCASANSAVDFMQDHGFFAGRITAGPGKCEVHSGVTESGELHATYVYKADPEYKFLMYVSGQVPDTGVGVAIDISQIASSPLQIAPYVLDGSSQLRSWKGQIYMFAVYSRALSESEITQNKDAGPGNSPPLPEDGAVTVDEDDAKDFNLNAIDPDDPGANSTFTFTITVGPTRGILHKNNGSFFPISSFPAILPSSLLRYIGKKEKKNKRKGKNVMMDIACLFCLISDSESARE